jgi:hypothetical protein
VTEEEEEEEEGEGGGGEQRDWEALFRHLGAIQQQALAASSGRQGAQRRRRLGLPAC